MKTQTFNKWRANFIGLAFSFAMIAIIILSVWISLSGCAGLQTILTDKYRTVKIMTDGENPPIILQVPQKLPDINFNTKHRRAMLMEIVGRFYVFIIYPTKVQGNEITFISCYNKYEILGIVWHREQNENLIWLYHQGLPIPADRDAIELYFAGDPCNALPAASNT